MRAPRARCLRPTRAALALAAACALAPVAFSSGSATGRPPPALREDFGEVKPMLKALRPCREDVEQEARANSGPRWTPSAAARAQAVKECEATNAMWAASNREELARVRRQNESRAADLAKAATQLRVAQASFDAEEKEVARLVRSWTARIDSSFRPDAPKLLADNPHLLVGATIAVPLRLIERRSPDSAIAAYANALVQIENIPPELPLFADRPFVMIARVKGVSRPSRSGSHAAPSAVVEWLDGGDCALTVGSAAARAGFGCLPWKGFQHSLQTASRTAAP